MPVKCKLPGGVFKVGDTQFMPVTPFLCQTVFSRILFRIVPVMDMIMRKKKKKNICCFVIPICWVLFCCCFLQYNNLISLGDCIGFMLICV